MFDLDEETYQRVKAELKEILVLRLSSLEADLFDRIIELCKRNDMHVMPRALARPKSVAALLNSNVSLCKAFFEVSRERNPSQGTSEDYQMDARIPWDDGELDDAILLYSFAIELDPQNGIAWMNRGNVQIELGNFESAVSDLLRARSLDADLPTLHAEIFQILSPEIREMARQKLLQDKRRST